MSAFDEIARRPPPTATRDLANTEHDETLSEDIGECIGLYNALLRVGGLILDGDSPASIGRLLRRICLEEVYRDIVLQLRGEDAQLVLGAIQLASHDAISVKRQRN
jgi:hypothetical protein